MYYLSAEYMLGRQLRQNLLYTGTEELARSALAALGLSLEQLEALDVEPGLGNGGLGRLAACLLDSLATLDIPAVGYGIRYDFGHLQADVRRRRAGRAARRLDLLRQSVGVPGTRRPARWSASTVGPSRSTATRPGCAGRWIPGESVRGEPSHMLVPGYGTQTVNIIRLWRARASRRSFDLARFGAGQYAEAVEDIVRSENISKVLYPDDSTELGRELRLKQQYFLVSCSLRDIIRRFQFRNTDWDAFPDKVVIQLNDTHPVLAIAELMRLLVDEHGLDWDHAWSITQRTFAYTCHTLLPGGAGDLAGVAVRPAAPPAPGDHLRDQPLLPAGGRPRATRATSTGWRRLSLIEEGPERRVRMAHLAVVGSFAVNGVAELHSRAAGRDHPARLRRAVAGEVPQRHQRGHPAALPAAGQPAAVRADHRAAGRRGLAARPGPAAPRWSRWPTTPRCSEHWRAVKRLNKRDLAAHAAQTTGVVIDPDAMCDVMIKRFHEYKRQLLKVLHVITLYQRIQRQPVRGRGAAHGDLRRQGGPRLPRGQADHQADQRRRRAVVNADPQSAARLSVAFLPDYNVSARRADHSRRRPVGADLAGGQGGVRHRQHEARPQRRPHDRHARTAPTSRSAIGSGAENFFLFGLDAAQAAALRAGAATTPRGYYEHDDGTARRRSTPSPRAPFSHGDRDIVRPGRRLDPRPGRVPDPGRLPLLRRLPGRVADAWTDRDRWTRMSILNAAHSGFFSSDRTIRDYCQRIWQADSVRVSPGEDLGSGRH